MQSSLLGLRNSDAQASRHDEKYARRSALCKNGAARL